MNRFKIKMLLNFVLLIAWLPQATWATNYYIGNSLTINSVSTDPDWRLLPRHIRGGSSLWLMYSDPNAPGTEAYPYSWPVDLLEPYEVATLQSHIGGTLTNDRAAIEGFVDYAPQVERWYLLQAWPRQTYWSPTYSDAWLAPNQVLAGGAIAARMRRAYFDELLDQVNMWSIPTGEVLFNLDQDGYNVSSLYIDDIHLNRLGAAIAHGTLLTTIHQRRFEVTGDAYLDEMIYQTVTHYLRSGYADWDHDGYVTPTDLNLWSGDARDFLAWQRMLGVSNHAITVPVPEPRACILLGSLGIFIGGARKRNFGR